MSDRGPRALILFELNEVPFRVIDAFCAGRPDSTLARLLPRCRQWVTVCENREKLSPWSTWPTLHRGVPDGQHGLLYLGQDRRDADARFPPVWTLLAAGGLEVGVFGSLHTHPPPGTTDGIAFWVPDSFAPDPRCLPEALVPFQRWNLEMSRASARNVAAGVRWRSALPFLASAPRVGLRAATALRCAHQLAVERLRPARRTRRRSLQALLAFDLFEHQLRATRPAFACFYTNHVAAAMHRYWAAAFPEDYAERALSDDWIHRYAGEIDAAMRVFDACLARLARIASERDAALWIASAAGQAATRAQPLHTQLHLADLPRFMERLGVERAAWSPRPGMAPHVGVVVAEPQRARFRERLGELRVAGESLHWHELEGGFFKLGIETPDLDAERASATLGGERVALAELGLANLRVDEQARATAHHRPEGSLLVFDPRERTANGGRETVSTFDVAPSILRHFGRPAPDWMRGQPSLASSSA